MKLINKVAITILFHFFYSFTFAQIQEGSIKGIIKDENGKPVSQAIVTIQNNKTGKILFSNKTDETGTYIFKSIPYGKYILMTERPTEFKDGRMLRNPILI